MLQFIAVTTVIMISLIFGLAHESKASEFNFAVLPVIPENQIDNNKSYFDLLLDKGQEQTLKVELRNSSDKDVTVLTTINSTTTNMNGVVEYGSNKIKPDKSLNYNMKDYTKLPKEVVIPKHDKTILKINVKSPENDFDGIMAGGITFKEKKNDKPKEEKEEKGLSIKNEFSYMVALLVRQNENKVKPNLNLLEAFADQVNVRNVISAKLQNDQPTFINQVKLATKITQRKKTDVLYSKVEEGLQIAPNSAFNYPTPLDGKELKPGKYTMHVLALGGKHADGKFKDEKGETYRYQWQLDKDFEISKKEANTLNEKDVDIKKDYSLWYIIAAILILLLIFLIIFWLKRKKDEAENDEESEIDVIEE